MRISDWSSHVCSSDLPGSQLAAGSPVLALVGTTPWIVANFKETQLRHMRIGQPVSIRIDAYPDHKFTARVDSVQAGRSEEPRVGKEWGSQGRSRWSPYHKKKKSQKRQK